ncbi:DUF1801 domain-containing protein [Roseivirga pacifica]|uniref:DUF1801 domain-containing protein n=1 Tax=Roseivirga pacifica TaxID=1267423 RepID=UPI0020944327|nr:DUF1801 domain-containing protein [Roseivirga pacifica]MCO6357331.1 DUF1801 domain-containing protein [Roseivirga pacifica]MCO6367955.1 DUF1801 domain-containing protein [Roseivirga pacifica]MCO6369563.1 DUF1801 domain-containing protein [Roseivirga pacifica]MCO6373417.1 DUF1801 domain-containing protein [Roseivirga pacifica]MCO6377326.1 DUF1801 domain-containing protein [Roseivirga pacifica]
MAKNQNKTTENDASVDDFLNTVADEKKKAASFQVKAIMEEITREPAKMWGGSIVGFGTYHYKYDSGREGDFLKIGFSPRAQNLTLYIMPGFGRYEELMEKLGKYKTGKSCLYVKKMEDIDLDILKTLIKESYDYMTNKYG